MHINFLKTRGETLFSFPLFLITFFLVFFLRFIRLNIRHFYFLSFCPVVSLFFTYLSPISGSLAASLAIFLFGIYILKDSIKDALHSFFSYFSGALFISLFRYLKFASDTNILIYILISSILYPLFFYIPLILKSRISISSHVYVLFWEHSFLFFYLVFTFLCYFFFMEKSFIKLFLLLPFFFISFLALRESLKVDKLLLLHEIENFLRGTFSLDIALKKIFDILKSHLSFDHMKVYVRKEDKFICVYSSDEGFKEKVFDMSLFENIGERKGVYIKNIRERLPFISENTRSFFALSLLKNDKLEGFMFFESEFENNFSEDDQERLMTVSYLVSRIIGAYLSFQEFPKLSENIREKSLEAFDMLREFYSFISKLEITFSNILGTFKEVSDKINKNFEVLESVAGEFEKGKGELSNFTYVFKEKKGEIGPILLGLKEKEESFEKLITDFQKLKDNIFETISLIERIEGFIEFMKDYASKTRLLSLNASIEATRLGEEARGFSIIAEEIGNLAQSVENVIAKLTHEFSFASEILGNTKSLIEEYENLIKVSRKKYLEPEEKERDIFIKFIEIFPETEKLPQFFEKGTLRLSEVIKTIGEELQDVETGSEKMKEVIEELKKLKSEIEKVEDVLNDLRVFSDKIKLLEELFRKGE